MALKLRVISEHYRELGENRSRVFGVNGGSVGRAPDHDWVLPDARRVVSGHHCVVQYHGGKFWLMKPEGAACPDWTQPVYRVYNNRFAENDSNHRYMTSVALYNQMVGQGWSGEGLVMCAPKV